MGQLAFSHPGKIGDFLYALPSIRYICEFTKKRADVYSSEYCRPTKRLVEFQSYVDRMYFPDNYEIKAMDMGVQPWYIPIDKSLYDITWQLGFRSTPDRPLPEFIAKSAGISHELEIKYDYPEFVTLEEPYIVMSPKGHTTFEPLFVDIINKCSIRVVQIGGAGDFVGPDAFNICGMDMLETTTWIAKSKGFVGMMSAMLVLANGFNIKKVSPHDGVHWDMGHVVVSDNNFYPVNPTAEEVLDLLDV